ncbi:hypothetical protein CAEBREN_12059 [Caenorhabditis brenneri]|uniref:Uncharacterized protein n=1 Tax=Caenorhabditis brenneri TaxID=135651 RepID=G0NTP0_CAEBE|nr:hypothetical protein CAEBREN_12059 [Caenorhabditis brenneri]
MNSSYNDLLSSQFHTRALYLIGTVTLPIHLFGAYCILFQTPDTMKRVKWVMLNQHFWCCLLDLWGSFLGQPYECPPIWGGVTAGILNTLGVPSGILVYLMVTSLQFGIIATAFLFENRFFLLFADQSWWKYGRYGYYLLNNLVAIVYFLPTLWNAPEQEKARELMFETYPHLRDYDHPAHPIYVVANDEDKMDGIRYRMLASIVFYLLDIFPSLLYTKRHALSVCLSSAYH